MERRSSFLHNSPGRKRRAAKSLLCFRPPTRRNPTLTRVLTYISVERYQHDLGSMDNLWHLRPKSRNRLEWLWENKAPKSNCASNVKGHSRAKWFSLTLARGAFKNDCCFVSGERRRRSIARNSRSRNCRIIICNTYQALFHTNIIHHYSSNPPFFIIICERSPDASNAFIQFDSVFVICFYTYF